MPTTASQEKSLLTQKLSNRILHLKVASEASPQTDEACGQRESLKLAVSLPGRPVHKDNVMSQHLDFEA
jgi:hypothetical protein